MVPSVLHLLPGQRSEIELHGLNTAGFSWTHQVIGDEGVIRVQAGPGDVAPTPGRNAPHVVAIEATAPGTVTLRLNQGRSWAPEQPPVRSHDITVEVGDDTAGPRTHNVNAP